MSTKLGLHVTSGSRNGYGDVVTAGPAAVLAVNEGGALLEAKEKGGDRVITIFREFHDNAVFKDAPDNIDNMTIEQAREAADRYWPELKQVYDLNEADYYQVTNETGGDNPVSLANIIAFETRLMELAERDGYKLAIGSPAGGSPGRWENWVKFLVPHIRRAGQGGHIYSRHAYGGVDPGGNGFLTKESAGVVIPADDNTGRPFREASYLRRRGINTPMVITETGQNAGYKFPGTDAFMEDVARYDQLCQEHDNIWGFCLWTYGNYQDRPANIENASAKLAAYLRDKGGATAPSPPAMISFGVVAPDPVMHEVHLLPPDCTLLELTQLVIFLHPTRTTFTYSADAAHAIVHAGDDQSRAVVWAGHRWADDIFDWLHQRGVATIAREISGLEEDTADAPLVQPEVDKVTPAAVIHTAQLLPPDTSQIEVERLVHRLHKNRSTFTFSADAAHALMFAGAEKSVVNVWSGQRWLDDIFAWLSQRSIGFDKDNLDQLGDQEFQFTHWPATSKIITQKYNVNKQNYSKFCFSGHCLTGHEGVDIGAAFGSPIFAVAQGEVFKIRRVEEGKAYGNAVYLRHSHGYRTTYAHLKDINVKVGDIVKGGQQIGTSDSTGNVWPKPTAENPEAGAHLHLTLYKDGATQRGETGQPADIIDPTPFLTRLLEGAWTEPSGPFKMGWAWADSLEVRGSLAKVINTNFVYLRSKPKQTEPKLGKVNQGTIVRISGEKQDNYLPVLVNQADVVPIAEEELPPPPIVRVEFGVHNEDGAEWMRGNGVRGWGLQTVAFERDSIHIDCTRFEQAGIKMLVRLNYGYGTKGNIPLSTNPDYQAFVDACVETMRQGKGAWGFIFGNETNNHAEWPGGKDGTPITAKEYVDLYNLVWQKKPAGVRLGPQAIDPYYGPGSDSRAYWLDIVNGINGADFLTVHPKTQGSDPDSIDSDAKFGDWPLQWQFLHLKSYQPLLDVVPPRFGQLPIIATEVNPQRKDNGIDLGWEPARGPAWVKKAAAHFRAHNAIAKRPISGVIFYRFSADDWRIDNRPEILKAIKQVAG